jgi:hypothetical protein
MESVFMKHTGVSLVISQRDDIKKTVHLARKVLEVITLISLSRMDEKLKAIIDYALDFVL